jgi:hypothetical protein
LTLLPAIFAFVGLISSTLQKQTMVIGMLLWFSAAPFWRKKNALDN